LKNYLEARSDFFYNNPYWTNNEKNNADLGVISEFIKDLIYDSKNLKIHCGIVSLIF
jgi:hypothetical protein